MKPAIDIKNLSQTEINEILCSKPIVFIGSGISIFAPTELPSGEDFCSGLFNYIFPSYTDKIYHWFKDSFDETPFEAIMECFPDQSKLPEIIKILYSVDNPNPYHVFFANKLKKGELSGIITPNYDLSFDSVLKSLGFTNFVRNHDEAKIWDGANSKYFKIHGTVEIGFEDTLVYTLTQEGTLDDWKIDLLTNFLSNKTLLFLGYSGRDFDICPLIVKLNLSCKIYWFQYCDPKQQTKEQELTAYQEYLLKEIVTSQRIYYGGFNEFIDRFFHQSVNAVRSKKSLDFDKLFNLSIRELCEWQLNILSQMACASLGDITLNSSKNILYPHFFFERTIDMLAHRGKYITAAKMLIDLLNTTQKNSKEHIDLLLRISSFWFFSGNYLKSMWYKRKAKQIAHRYFQNDPAISINFDSNKLMIWMRVDQIIKDKAPEQIKNYISNKIIKLREQFNTLETSGNWDIRQGVILNLERSGHEKGSRLSLPSYKGYKNLGKTGMMLIAYRDKVRYHRWDQDEKPCEHLESYAEIAKHLEMNTEFWKYCRMELQYLQLSHEKRKHIWSQWKTHLKVTEYHISRHVYERLILYWYYFKLQLFS